MRRMPTLGGAVAALLLAGQCNALAGEATEAVKPFYLHPGLELDPAERGRFVDPAKTILDQNDAIKAGGEVDGCLDPNLPFDDTDYDLTEVTNTMRFAELVNGDEARVVAAFKVTDGSARLEWKLKRVDGAWKVADIVSMSKDWALSQFNCQ
jgi:hypothetical protein